MVRPDFGSGDPCGHPVVTGPPGSCRAIFAAIARASLDSLEGSFDVDEVEPAALEAEHCDVGLPARDEAPEIGAAARRGGRSGSGAGSVLFCPF